MFAGEENGFAIDQEKLAADILKTLKIKKFDASITATGSETAPDINLPLPGKNIEPSAQLPQRQQPTRPEIPISGWLQGSERNRGIGKECSFNAAVGQRTEAKGCREQPPITTEGGCRRSRGVSHRADFLDATVSWCQPDFRFGPPASIPASRPATRTRR